MDNLCLTTTHNRRTECCSPVKALYLQIFVTNKVAPLDLVSSKLHGIRGEFMGSKLWTLIKLSLKLIKIWNSGSASIWTMGFFAKALFDLNMCTSNFNSDIFHEPWNKKKKKGVKSETMNNLLLCTWTSFCFQFVHQKMPLFRANDQVIIWKEWYKNLVYGTWEKGWKFDGGRRKYTKRKISSSKILIKEYSKLNLKNYLTKRHSMLFYSWWLQSRWILFISHALDLIASTWNQLNHIKEHFRKQNE